MIFLRRMTLKLWIVATTGAAAAAFAVYWPLPDATWRRKIVSLTPGSYRPVAGRPPGKWFP